MKLRGSVCKYCDQKVHINKGRWTLDEDKRLVDYMKTHGENQIWRNVPHGAGILRCSKSCCVRWKTHLRPGINKGIFTEEEDEEIAKLYKENGNRWSFIAKKFPGRTPRYIRGYCFTAKMKMKLQNRDADEECRRQNPGKERCPDLNLEPPLSPPVNYTQEWN